MELCPYCGKVIFSKSEIKDAAAVISNKRKDIWESAKEAYSFLCYALGPHYWGHEYSWEEDCNGSSGKT